MVPGQANPKITGEPEAVEDDGLGERDVYKDLKLPVHIDAMMHEHGKFLTDYGTTFCSCQCYWEAACAAQGLADCYWSGMSA